MECYEGTPEIVEAQMRNQLEKISLNGKKSKTNIKVLLSTQSKNHFNKGGN